MAGTSLKSTAMLLATVLLAALTIAPTVVAQDQVIVEYFHKPTCIECGQYVNSEGFDNLINNLKNEYAEKVYIDWLDVNYEEIMERLIEYNITLTPAVVFNGEYRLVRNEITMENLRETMDALLADEEISGFEGGLKTISASVIIVAGLVDGVNPCAISLLVFFISFLTGLHRSKGSVLRMGAAYILGLYVVYFALGLGLVNTISILGIEHPIGKLGAAILILLGVLNLRDAFTYETPLLKFPSFAVPMVKRLTGRAVIPAALVLGGFVSLFEFACSGGAYIGVLILLSSKARFWEGVGYLLLYNIFFALPLVVVLLLGTRAENLVRIDRWRVLNRRQMKAVTGVFMILLAVATYYWAFL